MKKIFFILPILLIFILALPVYAVKNNETNAQTKGQGQQQNQQQLQISASPTDSQVQNRNQINTQNQGEESQLQVNTQEQENFEEGQGEGLQKRNQNAVQNMSEVAKQVQQLLQIRAEGGLGEKIRQIAQEQNQAQQKIQEQLNKLESRGKLIRLLVGPDYNTVKNLKQQLEQNQLRIKQLEQLQSQLNNQGEITKVQTVIRVLNELNVFLQEKITAEEQTRSIFGWLFKFFVK